MDCPEIPTNVVLGLSFSEDGNYVTAEIVSSKDGITKKSRISEEYVPVAALSDAQDNNNDVGQGCGVASVSTPNMTIMSADVAELQTPTGACNSEQVHIKLAAEGSFKSPFLSPNKPKFNPVHIPSEDLFAELDEADNEEAKEVPDGYVPRGKCMSPMEKKIKQYQDECWAGVPFDPKPHVSRLEKEVGPRSPCRSLAREMVSEALEKSQRHNRSPSPVKQSLSSVLTKHKSRLEKDKEAATLNAKKEQYIKQAVKTAVGPSLSETLKIHKSRLQLEKEAAAVAAVQETKQPSQSGRRNASAYEGPSLSDTLIVHKSKLELEKEAAAADSAAITISADSTQRRSTSSWEGPGLDELKPHKSRLEKDKEAAAVAATTQRSVGGSRQQSRPGSASAYQGASLADSLKPHKSRLEREKEAAAASAVSVQQHAGVKVKAAAATWEGMGGLSDLKIHKSKLQRDREAWLAAEAQLMNKRITSNTVLSSLPSSANCTEDNELSSTQIVEG